jgi:hypothetical protein
MKRRYAIYERDGAVFRKPAEREHGFIDDVFRDGRWVPYEGNRVKPVSFGDFVRFAELDE